MTPAGRSVPWVYLFFCDLNNYVASRLNFPRSVTKVNIFMTKVMLVIFPVVVVVPENETAEKVVSNMEEVAARGGNRVVVASEEAAVHAVMPKLDHVWMPKAGEPVIARIKGIDRSFHGDLHLSADEISHAVGDTDVPQKMPEPLEVS